MRKKTFLLVVCSPLYNSLLLVTTTTTMTIAKCDKEKKRLKINKLIRGQHERNVQQLCGQQAVTYATHVLGLILISGDGDVHLAMQCICFRQFGCVLKNSFLLRPNSDQVIVSVEDHLYSKLLVRNPLNFSNFDLIQNHTNYQLGTSTKVTTGCPIFQRKLQKKILPHVASAFEYCKLPPLLQLNLLPIRNQKEKKKSTCVCISYSNYSNFKIIISIHQLSTSVTLRVRAIVVQSTNRL